MEPLPIHYDPKRSEKEIYDRWEKKGYFNPDRLKTKSKKTFVIVFPPPNITGTLHMGHALNAAIHDILLRYHRMKGQKTLCVPGTDHASIGLQSTLEKALRKEGINRFDLGREKFIERAWEWRKKYGNIILGQLRSIGLTCDWSRVKFTMDPDYVDAVETAFIHYHKKGWVYRGQRVVNWCPRCGTSISDLEVEYETEPSKLFYLKYPILGEEFRYITVATTRPETMLGDTAVAVNPKDNRYKDLVGKHAILPIVNRRVPIIADDAVDIKFGTGAVKVTPAHDLNDWQISQRHKLEVISVIDEKGKMNENVPASFRGLKTAEARAKIVLDLQQLGRMEKIEDYDLQAPKCSRCNATIQLIPSKQWFLKMDELAGMALQAAKTRKVKFHPARWEKTYSEWLAQARDWCVSRQLWWGQRLPVWFCQILPERYVVSKTKPKSCPVCRRCQPRRSEDVFDTWFSSALWPLAVFGWPKLTADLKKYYPTSVLITARDIINIWVARMVFTGLELVKKVPFGDVIIYATVLTADGKRMSKSLGTGVDPLTLIDKYGADATRFGLAWHVTELQDIHFKEDTMVSGAKFCNKIWNASRFVLFQLGQNNKLYSSTVKPKPFTKADRAILAGLTKITKSTEKNIEKYAFGHAIRDLYEFFWHEFCDVYIETAKEQIRAAKKPKEADNTKTTLIYVLANLLKLLHPFMPFVTQEVYAGLPLKNKTDLIISPWPKP
jgi:valyl-tRNA synthetase